MFLLALTALSVLALLPALRASAFGSKAAVRAAAQVLRPDTGMPEQSYTNHPVSLREARVTSDASSPAACSAMCPAIAESDDLDTCNTPADARMSTTLNSADTHSLPPSAFPGLQRAVQQRGLALGVSPGRAGQPRLPLPRDRRAHGPDLSSCTASPRPRCCTARCKPGETGTRRVRPITPALR